MAIGFPVNLAATPSFGIVGGFDRQFLDRYFMTTHIRCGHSCRARFWRRPLDEPQGRGCGNYHFRDRRRGTCYALPIEAAEKIRIDYIRFGEARHGWVGANVEDENKPDGSSRVRIAEVGSDSPALKAGLKEGDIVSKSEACRSPTLRTSSMRRSF